MKRKLLSALLTLSMLLTLLPTWTFAAGEDAADGGAAESAVMASGAVAAEEAADNDELFYQYMLQLAGAGSASGARAGGPRKAAKVTAKSRLNELEKKVYEALYERIKAIADSGKYDGSNSTTFQLPLSDIGISTETRYTATQLEVSDLGKVEGSALKPTAEAQAALFKKYVFDNDKIINALMADCPYELYWYDKTAGYVAPVGIPYSGSYNSSTGEITELIVEPADTLSYTFHIAQAYAKKEGSSY